MNCPLCAETIQDAAVLCRFCGAVRVGDDWRRVVPKATRGPGFMLKSSGALFLLGALFELAGSSNPVPLFGAMREGAAAIAYHALFGSIFLLIGVGLWRGTRWSIQALVVGGLLYSADKLLYMTDAGARKAEVLGSLAAQPELEKMIDLGAVDAGVRLVTGVTLIGFWLFVLYVVRRKDRLLGSAAPARG